MAKALVAPPAALTGVVDSKGASISRAGWVNMRLCRRRIAACSLTAPRTRAACSLGSRTDQIVLHLRVKRLRAS